MPAPSPRDALVIVGRMLEPDQFQLRDWQVSGPTRLGESASVTEYRTSFADHDLVLRRVRMDNGGEHSQEYRFKLSVCRGGDALDNVHSDSVTHELSDLFARLERQLELASPIRTDNALVNAALAWLEPRVDNAEIRWTVDGPYHPGTAGVTELSTTAGATEITLMYGALRAETTGAPETVSAIRLVRDDTVIALAATRDVATQLWRVTASAMEQHQARVVALQAQAARDFDGL